MLAAVDAVARGAAAGLGLAPTALTALMERGPHLLAPTGCDLVKHSAPGTVLVSGCGGEGCGGWPRGAAAVLPPDRPPDPTLPTRPLLQAGYHSDLNLLTVHGASRYPGLFVWTRGGERAPVAKPSGGIL